MSSQSVEHLSRYNSSGTTFGQDASDKISFYGVTPVVRASIAAAATDAATNLTLTNDIRTKLIARGLVSA